MKAIILAGGEGVRMRPLTKAIPKPLLQVAGRPLLHHLVASMPLEVTELVLVVGHLADQIQSYCGSTFLGRHVTYVVQPERTGTYGALTHCAHLLAPRERFACFYADDLIDPETVAECLKHERSLICAETEDPTQFGVISLTPDGGIKSIIEKPSEPPSNLVLANGFVLTTEILRYEPPPSASGERYLSTAVSNMSRDHRIVPVRARFWFPIATPGDLSRAETLLRERASRHARS